MISKQARRESDKKYYENNKEHIAERMKEYRVENKERIAERAKKYYEENKERVAEKRKKYYENNKEHIAERMKEYRVDNKDKRQKYIEDNKERIAENSKKYREENKERIAENSKKYHEEHKDKRQKYIEDNKERIAERDKKYREENRLPGHGMHENKTCSSYLGCHVAERVLSTRFKDVEIMPPNNTGYDFICNKGKKIDVKSSVQRIGNGSLGRWSYYIKRNKIADYFLCLAFDNRDDLNPLYIWLLPGHIINHLMGASISITTIDRWDEYRLEVDKVIQCCDTMKNAGDHTQAIHAV